MHLLIIWGACGEKSESLHRRGGSLSPCTQHVCLSPKAEGPASCLLQDAAHPSVPTRFPQLTWVTVPTGSAVSNHVLAQAVTVPGDRKLPCHTRFSSL